MLTAVLRSNPRRLRTHFPNLLTVAVIAVTTGTQYLLWPYFRQGPFILYYPAIVICALIGNAPLGILLSCVAAKTLFFSPPFSWHFNNHDAAFMSLFVIAGILIWQMGKAMRFALDESDKLVNELAQAIKSRDEFMSVASHELRTPLTSLRLQNQLRERYLTNGKKDAFTDEKLKRMFETDGIQINRLVHLVDDMLDISRIRTGQLSIDPVLTDLSVLVKDVVERNALLLAHAGCALKLQADEKLLGNWDRFRLEQVIANLLINASKYGSGRPIHISTRREGDRGILSVKDHGRGIAKENQARIFERFERAISANEVSGLGLGLFIAREILQLHDGTINVQSELGDGATFTISLPLAPNA